jgi:hypothetical protein
MEAGRCGASRLLTLAPNAIHASPRGSSRSSSRHADGEHRRRPRCCAALPHDGNVVLARRRCVNIALVNRRRACCARTMCASALIGGIRLHFSRRAAAECSPGRQPRVRLARIRSPSGATRGHPLSRPPHHINRDTAPRTRSCCASRTQRIPPGTTPFDDAPPAGPGTRGCRARSTR